LVTDDWTSDAPKSERSILGCGPMTYTT